MGPLVECSRKDSENTHSSMCSFDLICRCKDSLLPPRGISLDQEKVRARCQVCIMTPLWEYMVFIYLKQKGHLYLVFPNYFPKEGRVFLKFSLSGQHSEYKFWILLTILCFIVVTFLSMATATK